MTDVALTSDGQRAVSAPAAGRVSDTYYVIGDWVPAGGVVASLLSPSNVKIRFFVPETELGRVRPGLAISFSCDACGNPMTASVTYVSDRAEFTPPVLYSKENRAKLVYMIEAKPENLIGDRAYDSDPLDEELRNDGIEMIAPHRSNRSKPPTQDRRRLSRYKRRWLVERFFAWIQWQRRILVRWEYHAQNFFGFVQLACLVVLFRRF